MFLRDLRLATAHNLVTRAGGGDIRLPTDTPTHYLQALIDGLCALSLRDPLTGLANRRHFRSVIEREIDRVARSGETALLLMLDIDHFKQINDTHGHQAGDEVLRQIGAVIRASFRESDIYGRLGGEEFAVLLADTTLEAALRIAEQLGKSIAEMPLMLEKTRTQRLTASLGVASASAEDMDLHDLLNNADKAMYRAKALGRNQVVAAE